MNFVLNDINPVNRGYDCIVNGQKLGEITWEQVDGVMHMNHTYVSDQLRGQGVAKQLLDAAAEYARENSLKMNPICSYVVSVFEKSDEYDDIKM